MQQVSKKSARGGCFFFSVWEMLAYFLVLPLTDSFPSPRPWWLLWRSATSVSGSWATAWCTACAGWRSSWASSSCAGWAGRWRTVPCWPEAWSSAAPPASGACFSSATLEVLTRPPEHRFTLKSGPAAGTSSPFPCGWSRCASAILCQAAEGVRVRAGLLQA